MIFETPEVQPQEQEVIERIEGVQEALRFQLHEPRIWTGLLRRVHFAKAIRASNSIEGYNVTMDDAIAVAEGEDPVDADEPSSRAVAGYRRAMTYVLRLANDPDFLYTPQLVRSLHFMMIEHFLSRDPGAYRRGYIYVRDSGSGEIVYEGPDAERVPALVEELMDGLNETNELPVMTRAAMAHLNLVLIHPFRDGNGRMARCLQTLALAREGILVPEFCSIEEYLGKNTPDYYRVLAQVGKGYWQPDNDARPWVRFCLTAHYRQAKTILQRLKESDRLWGLLTEEAKRRSLPERYLFALFDASAGYRVRRNTYQPVAEISDNLATRDLAALVDARLLRPVGERRGRYYLASDELKAIRNKALGAKVPVEDPFETETQLLSEE